jgi:hypothetical protein
VRALIIAPSRYVWYILKGREVLQVEEAEWRRWYIDNAHELVLARQEFWQQGSVVTTMFLGVPLSRHDPKALFLTRVDGKAHIAGRAYHTYTEAMHGHLEVCQEVIDE